jgi:hypothetical protein
MPPKAAREPGGAFIDAAFALDELVERLVIGLVGHSVP